MNFDTLREQLRRAREQARVERKGVERVGMTLDEAAAATGLNRATIHSIENIRREPSLKPELETVERMALAYGLTLSSFFARVEGLSGDVAISDNAPPTTEDDPDDLPAFYSEKRIAQNVLRLLARLAVEGVERREDERAADHRLPPDTRALAAERSQSDRKRRRRNVPPSTKKRPPKR